MSLKVFFVTAVLLLACDALAFGQSVRAGSERQSSEGASQAEKLFQDALFLSDTKDRDLARQRLQEAMRLWVQMREYGKAANAALQMGDRYKHSMEHQAALYYKLALDVKSLPGLIRANALNAIAMLYAGLYQRDLALRYFNQALDQARRADDLPAQVLALTGLANLYHQQRNKAKVLACIAQAQELNRQKKADADPALLCLLGQVNQEEGLVNEAKGAFEEALAICIKKGNVEMQIRILCSLSTISLLASQKQEALEQARHALDLAEARNKQAKTHNEKVSVRELRWLARFGCARAERAAGQKQQAVNSYEIAIAHFEGVWWARYIATEASAIAFREEAQAAYRELVNLLMELGQFDKAYAYAERAKARAILNLTATHRVTPPSESAALRGLSQSIVRLRLQLLSSNLSQEQQAKLQKDISDLEQELQEKQLEAEMDSSKERLVWSQLVMADQVRKKMAQDQMALAQFSLGETSSFVWFFARGNVYSEILPPRKEIEQSVRTYLDLLAATPHHMHMENDLAKLRGQAEALFSTLFGRLAEQIEPGQRLIVVPDGLLHYLPFEALIHNGRYLVEDHEISYNPSASIMGLWQNSTGSVDSEGKMELLAMGDPVFEPKSKVKGSKTSSSNLGPGMLANRSLRLASLPRTHDEVEYIASLFPPDRRKTLIGRESTEEALKRESLRRYRRLHFATHSLIDEKSPLRSAVVLTPSDNAGEDGFLEVSEISRLNLDCDLVVISACQTGRGQLLAGEGVYGLSWAFLRAGAQSVVVSLWNVSDISTGRLMKNFYLSLTGGLSNVAALRKAKLQMLNSGNVTRHPYYWSSFVMIGKP